MPYYGGPGIAIEYKFVAVQPFDAEHPLGSGVVVHYGPGDEFPGEEWGNSAFNLIEMGKAVRLATNLSPLPHGHDGPDATTEEPVSLSNVEVGYPQAQGFGWYLLSDGAKIRGKDEAYAAQAALDQGGVYE